MAARNGDKDMTQYRETVTGYHIEEGDMVRTYAVRDNGDVWEAYHAYDACNFDKPDRVWNKVANLPAEAICIGIYNIPDDIVAKLRDKIRNEGI